VVVCAPLKLARTSLVTQLILNSSKLFYAVRPKKGNVLAKPALQLETETALRSGSGEVVPHRRPNVMAGGERQPAELRPLVSPPAHKPNTFQTRVPVIIGEATYRGHMPVDGVISGQLNAAGGGLMIKQRVRSGSDPELDGELSFKDLLRINGHVRGKVQSERGTLIVADAATVDAQIEVAVAIISGEVNGDVFARERVELGHGAVINGNISTPLLSIKPGATFHGDCRMLKAAG
jgi:cytoskeletal protein CcmA (bactofilin family)